MTHLEALATAVAYGALGAAHIEYMRYFEGWAHGLDDLRFPFNMIFRGFGAERTELTALTTLFFPMLLITWRGRSEGTAKCFPAAVYIAASAQICAYYHRLWAYRWASLFLQAFSFFLLGAATPSQPAFVAGAVLPVAAVYVGMVELRHGLSAWQLEAMHSWGYMKLGLPHQQRVSETAEIALALLVMSAMAFAFWRALARIYARREYVHGKRFVEQSKPGKESVASILWLVGVWLLVDSKYLHTVEMLLSGDAPTWNNSTWILALMFAGIYLLYSSAPLYVVRQSELDGTASTGDARAQADTVQLNAEEPQKAKQLEKPLPMTVENVGSASEHVAAAERKAGDHSETASGTETENSPAAAAIGENESPAEDVAAGEQSTDAAAPSSAEDQQPTEDSAVESKPESQPAGPEVETGDKDAQAPDATFADEVA